MKIKYDGRIGGLFALALLSGCSTVMTGYEAAAVKSIKAADDNQIMLWTVAACATPYSAAIRNPQVIPALKALCLPNGTDAAPATMFDGSPAK